jgi:hypothetical protein
MAVTTTPLGFKKPDGNELARNGDNVIADNAQVAQDQIAAARSRLTYVETVLAAGGGGGEPGSGSTLVPDPDNAGLYIIV